VAKARRPNWASMAIIMVIVVFFAASVESASTASPVDAGNAWAQQELAGEAFEDGEYLVRFIDGVGSSEVTGSLDRIGMKIVKPIWFKPSDAFPQGLTIYRVKVCDGQRINAESVVEKLGANPQVMYVSPQRKVYAYDSPSAVIPDDPLFPRMWGLNNTGQESYPGLVGTPDADIDAPEAWAIRHDVPEIVVAVLDTGIEWDHPDLMDNIWINSGEIPGNGADDDGNGYIDDIYGWDFANDDNSVYDGLDSHGTHTAGTIGAVGNNGLGVTGIAWNTKIMCLKFLEDGVGDTGNAIEALAYAWNNGAHITSNSWGYSGPLDPALEDAFRACDLLHICAAGNTGSDNDSKYPKQSHYPSSFPLDNIIAVAATDCNDRLAAFSCWGKTTVDIAAPGHRILSTLPTDQTPEGYLPYAWMNGTSMATPHVAGACAVLMAEFPDMLFYPWGSDWQDDQVTIKELILSTADKKPDLEGVVLSGGRLNICNALRQQVPPKIANVSGFPPYGSPPLAVTFAATVEDEANILDAWWDFGDGSEAVHAYTASHVYGQTGMYTSTFYAIGRNGIGANASVRVTVYDEGSVIFVDDDGGASDSEVFLNALNGIGVPWVLVEPPVPFSPDISNPVIWTTGRTMQRTLTSEDQIWLSQYLDNGGRLFLCGQDIIWDLGRDNAFVQQYLHVAEYVKDVRTDNVYGIPDDPLTDGMVIKLDYPFKDYSDTVLPDKYATPIFSNDSGRPCALKYYGPDTYRLVFFVFPFEAIPDIKWTDGENADTGIEATATDVMAAIYEFISEEGDPKASVCPESFDITLARGSSASEVLAISNTGESRFFFELGIDRSDAGNPGGDGPFGRRDTYGYIWRDSDSPEGPEFKWVDITDRGTLGVLGDDYSIDIELPFEFMFYGEAKNRVTISADGFLTFGVTGSAAVNTALPDRALPNDLIAVFWDDLQVTDGGVYYYYDAANERFIVSWVGAHRIENKVPEGCFNFQAILYRNGKIVYQYASMDGTMTNATVGIEDRSGEVGLQVICNAEYLHSNMAVELIHEADGISFGRRIGAVRPGEMIDIEVVIDAQMLDEGKYARQILVNIDDPVNPVIAVPVNIAVTGNELPVVTKATVTPDHGEPPLTVMLEAGAYDSDGELADLWWDFGDGTPPEHDLQTTHVYENPGFYEASFHAVDNLGASTSVTVPVRVEGAAYASVKPDALVVSVIPHSTATRRLEIQNSGTSPLRFMVTGFKTNEANFTGYERKAVLDGWDPNAYDSGDQFVIEDRTITKLDIGDKVQSWPINGVFRAWGCGYDGENVWFTDLRKRDWQFTTEGEKTGVTFELPWVGQWAADLAWDGEYLWHVNVGGDNRIYCIDPADGEVVTSIRDPYGIWDATSQRGIAYDPVEDVFYIGGWNQLVIYKIAGLSWPRPGEILRTYDDSTLPVAGIARVGRYLVLTLNGRPDMVAIMDSSTGEMLTWFQHPSGSRNKAGGCEADEHGNVWMTDLNNTAYLLDMGFLLEDMPVWLSADPVEDIVEPGAASQVTLAFDTDRMSVGDVCSTSIAVTSNALDNPLIVVPVTLRVDGLRASFEWREDEPNTVTFTDKSVDEDGGEIVSWLWDFGDGGSSSEQNPVHTYAMNHTYSVTLTVTDSDGAVASDTRQVVLVNAEPVVDFEYRFVEDLAVHFIDKSVDPDGIISSWAWDFGDGTVSSEQHPIHVYSELREYEVTLTVVDNDGAPATIARTMKPDMLPRVTLLAPVGGELWVGKHEIVWIATDVDDPDDTLTIKIEQSSDGGESWMTIADGENNEGLYIWDTTLLNKGGCYIVRITATDPKGGAGTDTSEEFTIIVISRSVVAAPNPAEDNVIFYYDIEADGRLYVYDVAGRLVYEAELPAAANAHHWNLMAGDRPISNGLYLYVLVTETGERSEVGRLVIQR